MVRLCVFGVALLLAPLALADSACTTTLPGLAPLDITKVPGLAIVHAAVPSASADGHAPRKPMDGRDMVTDCRGHTALSDWSDSNGKHRAGAIVVGPRQLLPDGRQAVWLYTGESLGAPATSWYGFLAVVRLAGSLLIVDGIGSWSNGEDAPRKLDAALFGPRGFVEPTGHTGTGGGTDSEGRAVWVVTTEGELTVAGSYDISGLDQNLSADDQTPHWEWQFTSTVKGGPKVHVVDHVTWTLDPDQKITTKTTVDHWYVLDGDKLRETTGHKLVPPPLPGASPAAATPPAKPSKATLSLDVGGGSLELTYDPAKISEAQLRAAVELSPRNNPSGLVPGMVSDCAPKDPGCGAVFAKACEQALADDQKEARPRGRHHRFPRAGAVARLAQEDGGILLRRRTDGGALLQEPAHRGSQIAGGRHQSSDGVRRRARQSGRRARQTQQGASGDLRLVQLHEPRVHRRHGAGRAVAGVPQGVRHPRKIQRPLRRLRRATEMGD